MKTVFSSHELPHLWAHQTQSFGRCAANMRFDGPNFFSYATVIATIDKSVKGETVFIVSEDHYSSTTAGHLSSVKSAIPHQALIVRVPGVRQGNGYGMNDAKRILEDWTRSVGYKLEEARTSRNPKRDRIIGEAVQIVERMRSYAAMFGVKKVKYPAIPASKDDLDKMFALKTKRDAIAARKAEALRIKQDAELRIKYEQDKNDWLNGTEDATYWRHDWSRYFPTQLRVVDGEVETSRGVSFPVSHAVRGLALVRAVIASGEEWKRNGKTCHLGHYQIDHISPDGTVYAGCHVVPFASIDRIASQLEASRDNNVNSEVA